MPCVGLISAYASVPTQLIASTAVATFQAATRGIVPTLTVPTANIRPREEPPQVVKVVTVVGDEPHPDAEPNTARKVEEAPPLDSPPATPPNAGPDVVTVIEEAPPPDSPPATSPDAGQVVVTTVEGVPPTEPSPEPGQNANPVTVETITNDQHPHQGAPDRYQEPSPDPSPGPTLAPSPVTIAEGDLSSECDLQGCVFTADTVQVYHYSPDSPNTACARTGAPVSTYLSDIMPAETEVVLFFPWLTISKCDGATTQTTHIILTTSMASACMSTVRPDGKIASLDFNNLPCGPGDPDGLPPDQYQPLLALDLQLEYQPDAPPEVNAWAHCAGKAHILDPPIALKRNKNGINPPKPKDRPS